MDMPKPGDAHTRLHTLAGQWGGEEQLHPAPWDPAGGPATAFINNRIALGGFAVVQEYEQYRDGKPTFSGHGLFWWDEATGEYVMTWTDSMMGRPADYRGLFEGDVLRLTYAMPEGGFARVSFDCGLPGEYVFLMETSPDGEMWTPAMEGAYGLLTSPAPDTSPAAPAPKVKAAKRSAKKVASKRAASRKAAPKKPAPKKPAAKKAAARTPVKTSSKKSGNKAAKKAAKKAARGKK